LTCEIISQITYTVLAQSINYVNVIRLSVKRRR